MDQRTPADQARTTTDGTGKETDATVQRPPICGGVREMRTFLPGTARRGSA